MSERNQKRNLERGNPTTPGYLLYLPPDYPTSSLNEKRWPVLFFLHGSGERGDNLELVKNYGVPKLVEKGQDFPFIIVSPQCPARQHWIYNLATLEELYGAILSEFPVDRQRVYLTGLSMGGEGVWKWAIEHPEHFAAIAPICGRSFPNEASRIKDVPTWVFHGAKDPVVPVSESERMVEALQQSGGKVKYTVYPEVEHNSWNQAYNTPELYRWLLLQSLDNAS